MILYIVLFYITLMRGELDTTLRDKVCQ